MRFFILLLACISFSAPALAGPLTKEELFELYVRNVPKHVVAQRMQQLHGMLDAAGKAQASPILKQDLIDALQARVDAISDQLLSPAESDLLDAQDTDL